MLLFFSITVFLFLPGLNFASPNAEHKKRPLLKLRSSVSSNFSADKKYLILLIQEYIAETLCVQKKIFSNSQKKFVEFNFVKEEIQRKVPLEYSQRLFTQSERFRKPKRKDQNNELYLTLFFGRYKYKDFLQVVFTGEQNIFFHKKYFLKVQDLKTLYPRLSKELRQALCQQHCHPLQLNVQPSKTSIYVNGTHMGLSPLKPIDLPPGSYKIEALKDTYQKNEETINIPKVKRKEISLKKIESSANILIKTNPNGANIYIDAVYKGKSPLSLKNLRHGRHKLRIVKQGFDPYEHFFYQNGQELLQLDINLVLAESRSLSENSFWGVFEHRHLYIASFTASLIFFSTGVYFSIEAANTRERLLVTLNGSTSDNYTAEESRKIQFSKMQESNQELLSISFYALGGLFVGVGIYFFIKNLHIRNLFMRDTSQPLFWFKGSFIKKAWSTGYTCHF